MCAMAAWWHFSVSAYNGTRLVKKRGMLERKKSVRSQLSNSFMTQTQRQPWGAVLCLCVCVLQSSLAQAVNEKSLVVYWNIKSPNRLTTYAYTTHTDTLWFFSCTWIPWKYGHRHKPKPTHTHISSGRGYFASAQLSVCVESSPMRLFHTNMICSPWTVLCELAHTRFCVCTHETVQSLFILGTTVSPYNVNH